MDVQPSIQGSVNRERALEVLLELRHHLPFTAALLTYRVDEHGSDHPLLVHQMAPDHVRHGLDYFIPSSPDFRVVVERPDEILDWNDVPSFRETATAKDHLFSAGYTQGTSLALRDDRLVVGSFHLNASHTDAFSADELAALQRAQSQLDEIVRGVVNGVRVRLSVRELGVLQRLALGESNREIADLARLSRRTVDTHVERILIKLGVKNRVQAVVAGIRLGLVDIFRA